MSRVVRVMLVAMSLSLVACAREEPQAPSPVAAESKDASDAAAGDTTLTGTHAPAESSLSIKRGVVMLASDRTTFRPCGESSELWVYDQTDDVLNRTFGSEAAGEPTMLYMEAYGERAPVEDIPEARGYAGVLVLEEVLYAGVEGELKGCDAPPADYIVMARGNEPFWAVEVHDGELIWRQPDEPREIRLSTPEQQDAEGAVRYRASGADRQIEVLIDARACRDGMSGELFAYSAKAVLDGREYNGCARVGR